MKKKQYNYVSMIPKIIRRAKIPDCAERITQIRNSSVSISVPGDPKV